MSTRSAKELNSLIEARLPGYQLSPESTKVASVGPGGSADAPTRRRARRAVDSGTPSVAELRRKYLGADTADTEAADAADAGDDDTDIVLVEPVTGRPGRSQPKAIVVGSRGRILGAQG